MPSPYIQGYLAAIRSKHKRRWSWTRFRWTCGCGEGWPCGVLQALITDAPGHWPA
jgi:hypothetical protein